MKATARLFALSLLAIEGIASGCTTVTARFPVRTDMSPPVATPTDAPEIGLAPTRDAHPDQIVLLEPWARYVAGAELAAYLHAGLAKALHDQGFRVTDIPGPAPGERPASFRGQVLSCVVQSAWLGHLRETSKIGLPMDVPFMLVAFTVEIRDGAGRAVFAKGYSGSYAFGGGLTSAAAIGEGLAGAIDAAIEKMKADPSLLAALR
jgi:hypothetical protein